MNNQQENYMFSAYPGYDNNMVGGIGALPNMGVQAAETPMGNYPYGTAVSPFANMPPNAYPGGMVSPMTDVSPLATYPKAAPPMTAVSPLATQMAPTGFMPPMTCTICCPSPYPYQPQFGIQQQVTPPQASGATIPGTPVAPGIAEESYIENILRLNRGKVATIYMTFENNREWNAKVFRGVIETAGRDHIIISDPQTGKRYLLLMVNLDYITFDEEINYIAPPVTF